jgi:hypothetical protein
MGGDAVMGDIGKRFPFAPYPKGWFQVAYSRDVDAGNKIYRERPQLERGEAAISEFRTWAQQSYEEALA